MKAVMLAAGVGRRLYGDDRTQPPKALLSFGGRTLIERHVANLEALGIDELVLVVGHQRGALTKAARAAARDPGFVRPIFNPRYHGGPIISLWTARDVLRGGDDVLFMDADVLYHDHLLERLVRSAHADCFLVDRDIETGEDPVRLCVRDGRVVEFGKKVEGAFDWVGEWPGFMRMSPRVAALVADAAEALVAACRDEVTYEEAMRAVLLDQPAGTFGYEDITGVPWIEIDFPSDLLRAERDVLPRLELPIPEAAPGHATLGGRR